MGACGNKADEKSYKEINDFYTGKLSSSDENVKLTVYQNSDDEDIYFVETVNNRTHSIYHYLWNSKDKKNHYLEKGTEEESQNKDKYMDKGKKVYESKISYDKELHEKYKQELEKK